MQHFSQIVPRVCTSVLFIIIMIALQNKDKWVIIVNGDKETSEVLRVKYLRALLLFTGANFRG